MNAAFNRIALLIPLACPPIVPEARSNVSAAMSLRRGRFLFRAVALGLKGAGLFALLQSANGRFLTHALCDGQAALSEGTDGVAQARNGLKYRDDNAVLF
jgi:hypothetical protein